MKYCSAFYTDIGIKKSTNEDSMLLQHAATEYGEVVFAVVCDGMGGLDKGELASAELIRAFDSWFRTELSPMIAEKTVEFKLRDSWIDLVTHMDDKISRYGARNGFSLGTTVVCLLLLQGRYYVMNIGDSRCYLLRDQIYQVTKDHTVVQLEVDNGLLTPEQALVDPRRNMLLQCVGASDYVRPDFFCGEIQKNDVYLLCCDGFRHVVAPAEIYEELNVRNIPNDQAIVNRLRGLTEVIKARGETDNISALAVCAR